MMIIINKKSRVCRIIIIFLAFFLSFSPAFALSEETLKFYSKNNILYYNPEAVNCVPSSSGGGVVYGETIAEKIWVGLLTVGSFTKEQAAGIMGNMYQESQFNPATHEQSEKNKYQPGFVLNDESRKSVAYGIGLVQWSFQRRIGLYNFIKGKDASLTTYLDNYNKYSPNYGYVGNNFLKDAGDDVTDALIRFEIEYLVYELNNASSLGLSNKYGKMSDFYSRATGTGENGVKNASDAFLELVENPANISSKYNFRYQESLKYYNQFKDKTIDNSTPPSDPSLVTVDSNGQSVTIIGDSIADGSKGEILGLLPQANIDSQVGRPFDTGISIAKTKNSELRENVIIVLGSNNPSGLNNSKVNEMVSAIGTGKNVYFVTNYTTREYAFDGKTKMELEKNNASFKSVASSSSNVYIIDWEAEAKKDGNLSADGLHPSANGQKALAELIYNTVSGSSVSPSVASICDPSNPSGPATPWDGDIPWYNQCGTDNEGRSYQTTKAGPNGYPDPNGYVVCQKACGVFSMASILTILTNTKVDPEILLDVVGKDNRFKSVGTDFSSLETYKNYSTNTLHKTMTSEIVSKGSYNETQYINYINNALRSGKFVWVAGNESPSHATTPFSTAGHFIAIRGIDASGNWLVIDPAGNRGRTNTFDKSFTPSSIYQHVQNNGTAIIGIGG